MASVAFGFLMMKISGHFLSPGNVFKDVIMAIAILASYPLLAVFLQKHFFREVHIRRDVLRLVPIFRIVGVLFIFVLLFFPLVFIPIAILDSSNSGDAMSPINLIDRYLRIFPKNYYLQILIEIPIFSVAAAVLYNAYLRIIRPKE